MAGGPARSVKRPAGAALGRLAALVAGALLVPALAGCGGGGDRDEATLKAAQSVSTADRTELRKGGTVRWAIDAMPATLNAFQYDADQVTDQVAAAVLPALFTVDAEGRVMKITLGPQALREGTAGLREAVFAAVGAAQDDARVQGEELLREHFRQAVPGIALDPAELQRRLVRFLQ